MSSEIALRKALADLASQSVLTQAEVLASCGLSPDALLMAYYKSPEIARCAALGCEKQPRRPTFWAFCYDHDDGNV